MTVDGQQTLARALRSLRGLPHDRARLDDRERGAPVDPHGSRVLGDLAGLGRQRVPAHVRRVPAPGRPARRPLRPPEDVPDRPRALHRGVACLRARDVRGGPRDRSGRAGDRRRRRVGCIAVADHDPLHRARRSREGDGRLRLRRGRRRDDRRAPRRDPHRHAELALDLPRQHPGRRRRLRALPQPAPRRARAGGQHAARCRGRCHRHLRAHARRLRDRERQRGGVDDRPDARPARGLRGLARPLPLDRVARRLAARSPQPLQAAQRRHRERRRRPLGRGDVRVVLPLGALPAAGARLQPARRGPRVPADLPDHGRVLARALGQARDAVRDPHPAERRPDAGRDRARALRPRAGRRELLDARAARA